MCDFQKPFRKIVSRGTSPAVANEWASKRNWWMLILNCCDSSGETTSKPVLTASMKSLLKPLAVSSCELLPYMEEKPKTAFTYIYRACPCQK